MINLANKILEDCKAQGITLQVVEEGQLKIRAPKGKADETLLQSIKDQKKNLIRILKGETFFEHHLDVAVAELNRLDVSRMDYPQSTKHRAFLLEGKIDEAANMGERNRFLALLKQWRECFN